MESMQGAQTSNSAPAAASVIQGEGLEAQDSAAQQKGASSQKEAMQEEEGHKRREKTHVNAATCRKLPAPIALVDHPFSLSPKPSAVPASAVSESIASAANSVGIIDDLGLGLVYPKPSAATSVGISN